MKLNAMQAKRIVAAAVLVLVAFLIVYPPLVSSSVKVALSSSSSVAAEHLYVTIGEISAHRADTREPEGWLLVSNQSIQIDLAVVNSTQTAALGSISLGRYDLIRVRITNATAMVNNTSERVQLTSSVFTFPASFVVQFGVQSVVILKAVPNLQTSADVVTLKLTFTSAS